MDKKLDLILSIMTLLGLMFIFGGIVLANYWQPAGYIAIAGFILMFAQSVITLCTWKRNKLSENIAAIGFVAGVPIAFLFGLLSFLVK